MKSFLSSKSIFLITFLTSNVIANQIALAHSESNLNHVLTTFDNNQRSILYAQFPSPRQRKSPGLHEISDRKDAQQERIEQRCERRWDEDDLDDCQEEVRDNREDELEELQERREEVRDNWD